jgi:hypothetical protein
MRDANLERQRNSAFGRYVALYMTHAVEGVRLAGFVIMGIGAWNRSVLAIVLGVAVVVLGWLRGAFVSWAARMGALDSSK